MTKSNSSLASLVGVLSLLIVPGYFLTARSGADGRAPLAGFSERAIGASAGTDRAPWSPAAPGTAVAGAPLSSATATTARTNGRIVFASTRDDNHEIYSMQADGSDQVRLTYHPAYDGQPRWSPDGTKIAFISRRENKFDIYTMNPDGTGQRKLTTNAAHNGFPAWSPDGARLAFVSGDLYDPNTFDLYVMNVTGGNVTRLTNDTEVDAVPAWSPDGARLAFMSGDSILDPDGFEIYVINADGSGRTRLTNNAVGDAQPAWSPDGAKLVFASGSILNPFGAEIFTINADGSGRTKLTDNSVTDGFPVWSPDGAQIVYASGSVMDESGVELFSMNADGTNPVRLTDNSALDWFPDWQRVTVLPPANSIQFAAANFQADEAGERATIIVRRGGDIAAPASVEYGTVDDPAAVRCDQLSVISPGTAYARCDYATTSDTLSFAAGQAEASFTVPLINDAHLEPPETLQLRLSHPNGATLGATATTVLTINSDDVGANISNPVDASPFFVRQQYLDFLSREPESDGFNSWLNVLNNCSDVNSNPACDRLTVSSSFFRSPEFELKGLYVYLFYRVSLDRRPRYDEISRDLRSVTGQAGPEVLEKRATFARQWGLRPEFRSLYHDGLADDAYVFALLARYNLNRVTTPDPAAPDGTALVTLTRDELIGRLRAGTLTRAQVLRALVQSQEVRAAEFNGAFVAMQYYGYLRREPEAQGYRDWLTYLNAHPEDFRTMINGFMNSVEYRLRFGRP
ncbi:MAG: DUF4214 domain-containing protein [Pyrinomonadaceae bacterium]